MDGTPGIWLDLSRPPDVTGQGRGTHGLHGPIEEAQLPRLWSLHLYDYDALIDVGGVSYEITPGTVSLVPPATIYRFHYNGPSTHLYAHFHADGHLIGEDQRLRPAEPLRKLQLIMKPGVDLPEISALMSSAIAAAGRTERTRADVWGVLLRLADRPPAEHAARAAHDHVRAAMSYIESRMSEPLRVSRVAAAVGISSNYLARVFAEVAGETVVGYIRRRRVDHARRLLTSSTMPIGAIASSVGFPDLQAFNKACRLETGKSPRQLRADP